MQRTTAEDYGKEAGEELAQTGSLFHAGVATYHTTKSSKEGIRTIERGAKQFPLADMKKALGWFHKYPAKFTARNLGEVKYVEHKVEFTLPHTTKEEIQIVGTVDLVVESATEIFVIDHKSGPSPSDYMLRTYPPQIAAYMYGVSKMYGPSNKKPIRGLISRIADLHFSAAQFYYPIGFDLKGAELLLKQAALLLEMPAVSTAGKHCDYCPLSYPSCFLTPEGLGGTPGKTKRPGLQQLSSPQDIFKRKLIHGS